jgi:hypothetical protein
MNGEIGSVLVIDESAGTVTEYTYLALGPGVNLGGFGPMTVTVNLEAGITSAGDPSGVGWQASAFAAVISKGVTGNVTGSGLDLIASSLGWSMGWGAGVAGMVTYTWPRTVYGTKDLAGLRLVRSRP